MTSFEERLEETLGRIHITKTGAFTYKMGDKTGLGGDKIEHLYPYISKDLKSLLLEVVREVVGKSEKVKVKLNPFQKLPDDDYKKLIRNQLRNEILEKVRGL